jgi:hypothetical protein
VEAIVYLEALVNEARQAVPDWAACALQLLRWSAALDAIPASAVSRLRASCPRHLGRLAGVQIDSLYYLGCDPLAPTQRVYDAVWGAQRQCVTELLGRLSDEGVAAVAFKGADVLARHFGHASLGLLGDVDLLVDRADLGRVKRIVCAEGYRQARYQPDAEELVDVDVADIAAFEGQDCELYPFCLPVRLDLTGPEIDLCRTWPAGPIHIAGGDCIAEVELDIHHCVALDIETRPLLDRRRPSALGAGSAMSPADHLWFITARLYNAMALRGKGSMRDFVYIIAILGRESIDWDVVLGAAEEYELRPALYYLFSFVSALGAAPIPSDVLAALSPLCGSRVGDWGWQIGRLFEVVDPCPLPLGSAP